MTERLRRGYAGVRRAASRVQVSFDDGRLARSAHAAARARNADPGAEARDAACAVRPVAGRAGRAGSWGRACDRFSRIRRQGRSRADP
ncbi:hypothetical protein RKD23_000135 [Streptomyces sp. SAI-170]